MSLHMLRMNVALSVDQAGNTRGLIRVLRLEATQSGLAVATIDMEGPTAWPRWTPASEFTDALACERARVVELDYVTATGTRILTDEDLAREENAQRREVRDRRWSVIAHLVEEPEYRLLRASKPGPMIRAAAAEHRASPANVRIWVRRYWQRGQLLAALAPDFDRCGAPGRPRTPPAGAVLPKRGRPNDAVETGQGGEGSEGINVDAAIREKLRKGFRFEKAGMRPSEAYNETLAQEFYERIRIGEGKARAMPTPGVQYPEFGQYFYHTRDLRTPAVTEMARLGARNYNLKAGPRTGSSTHLAVGPGSVYQVDATVADAYLVSRRDRSQVIGRPIIYVLVDMFSRMICGLHVSLRPPSWIELAASLLQAFTDKVPYCAALGRAIGPDDWPCAGVPERVMGDRGEPIRRHGTHAVKALKFALDTTAPYRADWKGIVENRHLFLSDAAMRWMPGWVERDAGSRGAPDYRKAARYTLDEFTLRMLEFVLWHNNDRPLRSVPLPNGFPLAAGRGAPCPRDLWTWGVAHVSGVLKDYPREFLWANLLPSWQRVPSRDGIRLTKGVYYTSDSAVEAGLFVHRWHGAETPAVELAADPRRLGTAYMRAPDGRYEPAQLTGDSTRFADWSLNEVRDEFKRLQIAEHGAKGDRRHKRAERDARVADLDDRASHETEAALRTAGRTAPRIGDMREARSAERAEREATGVETRTAGSPPHAPTPVPRSHAVADGTASVTSAEHASTAPTARPSYLKLLRGAALGADASVPDAESAPEVP